MKFVFDQFVFDHVHLLSADPAAAAQWYVEMFDATIAARYQVRGAVQLNVQTGGMTLLIRGHRDGEAPATRNGIKHFGDYSSHDEWGMDHFGFTYHGDLLELCKSLKDRGAEFAVKPWEFSPGLWICYIAAPDGVSIEIIQARDK